MSKFLALFPLFYIIGWAYFLITFEIPTLQIHIGDLLSLNLAQILGFILFIFPFSIPLLFIAVVAFFIELLD